MRFNKTITGLKRDLKKIVEMKRSDWKLKNIEKLSLWISKLMDVEEFFIQQELEKINRMLSIKIEQEINYSKLDKSLKRYNELLKIFREVNEYWVKIDNDYF